MADLHDLHQALLLLGSAGKTAKVSFYYVDETGRMLSGSIAVEQGRVCHVNFRQLEPEPALEAMAGLNFAKVTCLPAMSVQHAESPVAMATVLDRLDPRRRRPPVVPAAAPAPAAEPSAVTDPVKPAHVFYSHLSMQQDALQLLEPLFGLGAAKKLEEFARLSPPAQLPEEFLGRCRQHAAMMLGAGKAEELFKPVFDRLRS